MMRILYRNHSGVVRTLLEPGSLVEWLEDEDGLLWVDFQGPSQAEDEHVLQNTFGFHPLAVDDALRETHTPKIDDWGSYLYIVVHACEYEQQGGELITQELDIFLGENYLVTHHTGLIQALERTWQACQRDERHLKNGADHLLYRLLDEVATSYMPVVDAMDEVIDQAEDQIFDRPTPKTLESIFSLKRSVLHLRRILGPQREVLNKLARDDYVVIDEQAKIYFRDVYDHLVRLHDLSESVRDLVSGALDTYLSVINNRMNDIMKTLTIITTLFMPMSFVASFFGMNFFLSSEPITAWTDKSVFLIILILMVLIPVGMYWWMRRRGWM